jgi:hypothetical protein
MRVKVAAPTNLSRAMFRVEEQLANYAPAGVRIVKDSPDMVVLHVIDSDQVAEAVDVYLDAGIKVAIIQYCLKTAKRSDAAFWKPIWEKCELVWSYYDIPDAPRFYRSPLGVSETFVPRGFARLNLAMTSGYVAESECLTEVARAVTNNGGAMIHLGPALGLPADVQYYKDISDVQLSKLYSMCRFVMGLRRGEGFELPLAEGLLCGARPVTFDQPHYRAWFSEFAEFIPEGSPEEVTEHLKALFASDPRPVTAEEMALARQRFNWETICRGFWERAL